MNWLAHLYLSEPNAAFRIGNLLPDMVSPQSLASLPEGFQRGIQQHRRIDAFTDAHPIVRRSIQRVESPFRRFGGILCDLFYDHFLARDWHLYSQESLPEFASAVYESFEQYRDCIPVEAWTPLRLVCTADLLCSYREVSGIEHALGRIDLRLRRSVGLGAAIAVLEKDYEGLRTDFGEFFPELHAYVADRGSVRETR